MSELRWVFADQLGPHHVADLGAGDRVLLVESTAVLGRRTFHRQKAHLVLSGLRHLAAELGERAVHVRAATYADALAQVGEPVTVRQPTSFAADRFCREHPGVTVLPDAGFATSRETFEAWASGRGGKRLLMEDFYREQRRRHEVLMEGADPVGGRWNLDHDNRQPPPRGAATLDVEQPWWPTEDAVDDEVRRDLDALVADGTARFLGADGTRWAAATRTEALAALDHFVTHRLALFGPYEDAMLTGDRWMAHSALSPALNLGLLHPVEVARAAEKAYADGTAPLASVEGFVRQVLGWREYVWGLYWHLGEDYRARNALGAHEPLPEWLTTLDAAGEVRAACVSSALRDVREVGWTHHIPRLMVLGNYALQRGLDPAALTAWFHEAFVDGYDWVMLANVVGMSQHADGGLMATKPYASGGAYLNRMSDHCKACPYSPTVRVGEKACPFTAGYWAFLDRHRETFAGNHRMAQAVAGLGRLSDLEALIEQERERGTGAP